MRLDDRDKAARDLLRERQEVVRDLRKEDDVRRREHDRRLREAQRDVHEAQQALDAVNVERAAIEQLVPLELRTEASKLGAAAREQDERVRALAVDAKTAKDESDRIARIPSADAPTREAHRNLAISAEADLIAAKQEHAKLLARQVAAEATLSAARKAAEESREVEAPVE